MKKDTIEPIFNYTNWTQRLYDNQIEDDNENSIVDQVMEWKQRHITGKNGQTELKYYLVFNLHRLEQKVWGDFKVQFKSDQASFYFWLNVSAILYNEELRKVTEREQCWDDPIHFEEFQEIEEADLRSNKNGYYSLLMPDSTGAVPQDEEDKFDNMIQQESQAHLDT